MTMYSKCWYVDQAKESPAYAAGTKRAKAPPMGWDKANQNPAHGAEQGKQNLRPWDLV